jgi:diguanylate cyclase (GGDEF)-like protein/PAS domain S-box-containing protein
MAVRDTEAVGLAASRVLFDHSSDGVLFSSPDGLITAANPAACALLEASTEEICVAGFEDLADQDDPRWGILLAERNRTGTAVGVARLRRGDGRFIELETTSHVFRDEDGTVRVYMALRDPTSRLAIEKEMEELSARLLRLSRGDELTGLPNRRGLIASGTLLLQHADRQGAEVQVAFVDVRNVTDLNERLGHQAGDAALQAVVRALSVTFRPHDVLARIGGTEFLALALMLDEADAGTISGRVQDHLAAPETTAFVGAPVEVSFGWTARPAGDRSSLEDLIARADWAMLEGREAGRATAGQGSDPGSPQR